MKALKKAHALPVTERQKAWGRLALLTVVGLVCPPLAAARSGAVWGAYLILLVLYSLWTVRVTSISSRDGELGYLLNASDAAVLIPMMVWSLDAAIPIVLSLLWLIGAATSWRSARARCLMPGAASATRRTREKSHPHKDAQRLGGSSDGAPLERALRVRLKVLQGDGTRFALVMLKLTGLEAMIIECGKEATKAFLQEVSDKGMRLLQPDAQVFPLPGGRMAFVFATESAQRYGGMAKTAPDKKLDPHDVESMAMALATKACEGTLGGHRLECVVGWASAPADGTNVDDLMFAAETGVLSTAAFRRVGGSRIAVPEHEEKRAIAG